MTPHHPDDDERNDALASGLASLMGTLAVAAFVYLAALGFAGGTVPLAGWDLPGGALPGLLWLAVLGSVGFLALWLVPLLAVAALCSVLARVRSAAIPVRVRSARRARPLRQAA